MSIRQPLEPHTRTQIDIRLKNLGWILDQRDRYCTEQNQKILDENKYQNG